MIPQRGLLIVSLCLLPVLYASTVDAASTYYVAPTGSDTGTGSARCTRAKTVSTPLLTINIALSCAVASDTVQVASGTYVQRIDLNSSVGGTSAGGFVTLQGALPVGPSVTNTTGATVLNGSTLGNGPMIYGRHVAWMRIRNFAIGPYTGGGIFLFGNTTHVEITDNYVHDSTFYQGYGSAIRVTAKYSPSTNISQGSNHGASTFIVVARNRMEHIRTGFMGTLPEAGSETLTLASNVSQFLIEDNLIIDGQFIGIDLIGHSHEYWGTVIDGVPPGTLTGDTWPHKGIIRRNTIRSMRVGFGAADIGFYCDGCRDIVYESNDVQDVPGYAYHTSTEENQFLIGPIIVRYNRGFNAGTAIFGIGPGINSGNPAIHGLTQSIRAVHNTGVKTKANGPVIRFGWSQDTVAKNNIATVSATVNVPYVWAPTEALGNPLSNYTLYWGSIEPDSWQHNGITYLTFPSYQAGSGQDAQGLLTDPKFTNITTRDLTLQATSPALEAGTPLTTTTSAGTGTVVPVADAHYFIDGYGVTTGDAIQIGSDRAIVLAVNNTTNEVTLDRTLTWGSTSGVSYPYGGTAPALGACEGTLCGMQAVTGEPGGGGGGGVDNGPLLMNLALNEGSGTSAHDATSNLHDGTLSPGATWAPGKHGASGVMLDGTPSGIVTVAGLLSTPANLTLAAWVRPSGFPTGNAEVVTLGPYHALRIAATKIVGFWYTVSGWLSLQAVLPVPLDVWSHLVLTYEPGAQGLYLNGNLVASGNNSNALRWSGITGSNTLLGAHGGGLTTYSYQGILDEVRIYNVPLSAAEVLALYREQVGLVAHRIKGLR